MRIIRSAGRSHRSPHSRRKPGRAWPGTGDRITRAGVLYGSQVHHSSEVSARMTKSLAAGRPCSARRLRLDSALMCAANRPMPQSPTPNPHNHPFGIKHNIRSMRQILLRDNVIHAIGSKHRAGGKRCGGDVGADQGAVIPGVAELDIGEAGLFGVGAFVGYCWLIRYRGLGCWSAAGGQKSDGSETQYQKTGFRHGGSFEFALISQVGSRRVNRNYRLGRIPCAPVPPWPVRPENRLRSWT